MTEIQKILYSNRDEKNAKFQASLTPGVDEDKFMGVRVPVVRKIAKEIYTDKELVEEFLKELPHEYFDENMLHAVLISMESDYDRFVEKLEAFFPYIDNWAVSDTIACKSAKKNPELLIKDAIRWAKSDKTYTCRVGVDFIMSYYLNDYFKAEYNEIVSKIVSDEYYVNMMVAWYFATALAKQWEATIPYIEEKKLSVWVHNKTIQKSVESFRVTNEHKDYLRTLRIKK
ncbi:MAG: DNA alkylation repair protein [Lachnospiraceae bacterium]|nr:DNA alkylation repair protein [Lachnospiraceae bacterium]